MAIKEVQTEPKTRDIAASGRGFTAPYFDLDFSLKVAEIIYNKGGGACTGDQLAAWLEYASVRSGTYLTRVSAANKHFGLIEQNGDTFSVTERAKKILAPVMPEDAVNAKVEAFMAVPLFVKVYEQFRGSQIPPEVGLKNLFQSTYKLLPDRALAAVRIFLNSAEQAGLLTADRTRLIKPAVSAAAKPPQAEKDEPAAAEKPKVGGSGGDGPRGIHEAISGLLRYLPPPGTPWSAQKKEAFMKAFTAAIDLIYPEENAS
jgi:hypothetical protein